MFGKQHTLHSSPTCRVLQTAKEIASPACEICKILKGTDTCYTICTGHLQERFVRLILFVETLYRNFPRTIKSNPYKNPRRWQLYGLEGNLLSENRIICGENLGRCGEQVA